MTKPHIPILCTGNSARSQMTKGLLRHLAGDRYPVDSAGTKPSLVRPEAIAVMAEPGIDLTGHRSKSADEFTGQEFRCVITVCEHANEACPVFPGRTERLHWPFEDPAGVQGLEEEWQPAFREVRDQIRARIEDFPTLPE
jgi:arsenate reductase